MKYFTSYISHWILFVGFTLIIIFCIGATTVVIDRFKKQEIQRVEVIATSMKFLQNEEQNDPKTLELILAIIKDNNSIPIILTDKNKKPILAEGTYRNISIETINDPEKLTSLLQKMGNTYQPFPIKMPNGKDQYVFYSNSKLLDKLQYYPWILAMFIGTYLLFSFYFFVTIKKTDENYLWVGLAKETAHQIGTPLSSMLGWIEILKLGHKDNMNVKEIEKDINRLVVISERFSKIGSVPELTDLNLKETLSQNYEYLKSRISSHIKFSLQTPEKNFLIPHNKILISWVIENLVKNAVDAMKGSGKLEIKLSEKSHKIFIDVEDTGSGMTNSQIRNIFKTGYSTKKRGWGLGLSLVKRVITEYHNGEIKVLSSEIGKGTIFRITL